MAALGDCTRGALDSRGAADGSSAVRMERVQSGRMTRVAAELVAQQDLHSKTLASVAMVDRYSSRL